MEQEQRLVAQLDAYSKHTMTQMKVPKISNKAPNPIQITAEQIIADPELLQLSTIKMPIQHLVGQDEVLGYKEKKRKEFENSLRRQRFHIGLWIRYAEWEGMLQEFRRARSVFERALDVTPYSPSLWMRYVEFEMKNKFLNHARNIFERACVILPRVDRFWFKYIYMEEILGNYEQARQIFKKWMEWNPIVEAWVAFASFETRIGETETARRIMYEFLDKNPKVENYIRVSKYEEKFGKLQNCRAICERTLKEIGEDAIDEGFFIYWINLEEKLKEIERASQLYDFAFKSLKQENTSKLKLEYLKFQSKFGKEKDIDKIICDKRRALYQKKLEESPQNYDCWISLCALEEELGNNLEARKMFEKAEDFLPFVEEKSQWKRFVSIFILHAVFEETIMCDSARAAAVLEKCLKIVPHLKFSFSKLWIHLANIHIRTGQLQQTRAVMGRAIGQCGSQSIFDFYIDIESKLGNFDRCRKIFEKAIEMKPNLSDEWVKYFKMEVSIGETVRAESIINKSLDLGFVDHPEVLWKTALDYHIEQSNHEEVIRLYQTLLRKTKHVQVFVSLSLYYLSQQTITEMRKTFEEAELHFKSEGMNEERASILNNWYECELQINEPEFIEKVQNKLPTKIKKQRMVSNLESSSTDADYQYEEYIEYMFGDEPVGKTLSNLQKKAQMWKKDAKVI